jgi:tRNA wybutosine-synthesizing protein 3
MDSFSFTLLKERAMKKLRSKGMDENESLRRILERINGCDSYFTTSSCSGRIVLLQIPEIGAKKNAFFLGKWHKEIGREELSLPPSFRGELWLIAQGPILHVAAENIDSAASLLKKAKDCGFKRSGIFSISERLVLLEILSTERMDVPLGTDGKLLCSPEHLELILEKANEILRRSNEKLRRLAESIDENNLVG